MSNLLRRLLLIFAVVISGALCTVEDYVIMSQCAHNKAIHLAAEGTVSVSDISQTQNITILGLPDFVNNAFKIALYAKETQRYLCFSENWRLVALKELQNTCYFNETIVHGYFVFRSVVDLQRRIGFTHRGKAVGPKKNVNDACYLFTKIQADEFFHQHNYNFAHKTTSTSISTATTTMATTATLPSNRLKMQRNKNKRRNNNNNSSNNNQNQQQLNGHNSNISSNLSSNKQNQQQKQQKQNQKLEIDKKDEQHFKSHHHHQPHHHHEKHHQVRHHHNNPDVIARRQQHEQKQKRRPHNRLRMIETTKSTSATTQSTQKHEYSTIPNVSALSTLSKRIQTAFTTTPSQRSTTISMTPKLSSNKSKLLTTVLLPTSTARTTSTTTATMSKRKGRRRKHKKHTHKQQKLQQSSVSSQKLADDKQNTFATEENESAFSLSSLAASSWSEFTSMANFLDEATSYYGNDWLSSSSSLSSESFAVSPTASLSSSSTQNIDDSTSYSSPTPIDESTNVAYTTHSINNRKKSQISTTSESTSDFWSPEAFYEEMESTLNGLFSQQPDPTVALPKMKSTTSYQTKVNSKQYDLTEIPTTTNTASSESNTSIGEYSTKNAATTNAYVDSTTQLHESTPTLSSNTIIDVNINKWLTNIKENHNNKSIHNDSSAFSNIDKNISKNSMTEFINSTRSSNNHNNDNVNQTVSNDNITNWQQYQQPIGFSDNNSNAINYSDDNSLHAIKLSHKSFNNTNTDTTTLATKRTTIQPVETTTSMQKSTTLSPLLQLFSPYFVTKSNSLLVVEKNINNGNINNSLLEEKTPTAAMTTTTATSRATNTLTTQTTPMSAPLSISPTPSMSSSVRKTIRKSTQKLLATPFHQLTTYVRNEAGDIDIDNIDNISVYPDLMDSETLTDDVAQLKRHQQQSNSNNNTNSRLIVVSGYLPTSASAILPESIQIAKIKINNERQRLWPQRSYGNSA